LDYEANIVIPIGHEIPSSRVETPTDMTIRGVLEEGIAQLNEAGRLGPEEEIQQGNFRLQEIGKARV